jgi:hypothetical protein
MALPMDDTAYILTYREYGDGERHDNLLAVLRWLERRPLLEVVVLEQDSVPRVEPCARLPHARIAPIGAKRFSRRRWRGCGYAARAIAAR